MTTPTTVNIRLQLRADTAANWTAANPTLLANEVGLETDTKKLKVGSGSTAWNSLAYFPSIVTGGTVLGNLEIGSTGTLTFEGSTADGFETTLAVTNPTADRTITLPNQSGTVVVSGNASIVNADIAANAEIAVSKLANGTANQVIVTDGTNVSWSDDLTLAGNLTVNGTTTTISTQNLLVEDKNIIIGNVDTPTDVTADGGGITLKGATDKTINWVDSTDAWTSSERFSVPLGSAASPSLTFTGDENTGIYSPGADQVAVATNGTGRVFINASGDIGFGSQFTLLQKSGTLPSTDQIRVRLQQSGGNRRGVAIRVTYVGGWTASNTSNRKGFFDAIASWDLSSTNTFNYLRVNDIATRHTFGQSHFEVVPVGASNQVDVIIRNPSADQHSYSLKIEVLSSEGVIAVIESVQEAKTSYVAMNTSHELVARGSGFISAITDGSERLSIDSSGRLLAGTSSTSKNVRAVLQGNSTGAADEPSIVIFAANTATPTGGLGLFRFSDNAHNYSAEIGAYRDGGTWTSGTSHPTRLVFSTTADGASSPTERMRITNDGVMCYDQAAPVSYAAAATLVVGDLKNGLVQYTGAAATLTLPTGTLTEGGFAANSLYTNITFEWSVINTGSGTCTVGNGTGHTVTGSATVAAGASGRFASRRTAANTFVSYRLS